MPESKYLTYEVKNSNEDYTMAKTNEKKIIAFASRESLMGFIENKNQGLLRILNITEDIKVGNIPLDRIELLE